MLGTCMFFLPIYAGIRLAAERSDAHVDLVFVTTLPPRAIVSGKFLAALVLAIIIFSACTPFLFFTYFLRGIDWASILFVVAADFLAVALVLMAALFLALIPAHWIFKALLAVVGLGGLVWALVLTLILTQGAYLDVGVSTLMAAPAFWANTCCTLATLLGVGALLYSWSVAILSPPSANRALMSRITLVVVWTVTLALTWIWTVQVPAAGTSNLVTWVNLQSGLTWLAMLIAVSERESWSPRTGRTIPRRWWLRPVAFLFYSGAAGGLTFAVLLCALTLAVARLAILVFIPGEGSSLVPRDSLQPTSAGVAVAGLYAFSYALTALLIRRALSSRIPPAYTWVVGVLLFAAGCLLPFLTGFLLFFSEWRYDSHYRWLVTNPFVAVGEVSSASSSLASVFVIAVSTWALVVAVINVPWFWRQVRAFRPYLSVAGVLGRDGRPLELTPTQAATTKTM
jgi:hypothetical protein